MVFAPPAAPELFDDAEPLAAAPAFDDAELFDAESVLEAVGLASEPFDFSEDPAPLELPDPSDPLAPPLSAGLARESLR